MDPNDRIITNNYCIFFPGGWDITLTVFITKSMFQLSIYVLFLGFPPDKVQCCDH